MSSANWDPRSGLWAAVRFLGLLAWALAGCELEAIPLDGGVGAEGTDAAIEVPSTGSDGALEVGGAADRGDAARASTCRPGEVQTISCPDGEEVVACECRGHDWICQPSPERLCPSTPCDDGEALTCGTPGPACPAGAIAAVREGCWQCVDPGSCRVWAEVGCETDAQCSAAEHCDPCGRGACPDCDECVAACRPHGCETESEPRCDTPRPVCLDGEVSILQLGCWQCVDALGCDEPLTVPPESCNEANGYCEHRRTPCREGFEEDLDLDCERGQSRRCCRPEPP